MTEPPERDPTRTEIKKFARAAKSLADLGKAGLHFYVCDGSLILMTGRSHDDLPNGRSQMRTDRAVLQIIVPNIDGGGW